MSLAPGDRLGVYEIVGLIGAGGMGEVYRARDARLNRDVAIKVLPNILSVFDVGARREVCAGVAGHHPRQLVGSPPMMRLPALILAGALLSAHALAQPAARPLRIVLIVDSTDAIRQPIGTIRRALATFVELIDTQHEMMLVSVAGTPQIRVRPTLDRQQLLKSVNGIFGTTGSNVMHRTIDDLFHRFAQPADRRPVFVVLTTEGFESTQDINPQEIAHVTNHFVDNGGTLHAVRLQVATGVSTFRGGNLTELPVSLMIARGTSGAYTNISPNGLLDVLQRLATVINEAS